MVNTDEKTTKALNAVKLFCSKAYGEHGKKRTSGEQKGWFEHDWGDLVQTISYIDYGHIQEIPTAATEGASVRKEYLNNPDWNTNVNRDGVHEKILTIIRVDLAIVEEQQGK